MLKVTQKNFLQKFKDQFELLENLESLTLDTNFKHHSDWDSLTSIMVLAMIEEEYDVALDGSHIKEATSVRDLFDMVISGKPT